MTTIVALAAVVVALALVTRSRKLSLLAGILCVGVGYYLGQIDALDVVRREIADGLTFAVHQVARLIPGIEP